jgi:chaperonin GroEL
MLGSCGKVVVSKDSTIILDGKTSPEAIGHRVMQIKEQLLKCESEFETEFLTGRIARLVGGIGTIKVGGITELEMKERKDRIDDAICATKAAIEMGIVPGGGISFLKQPIWKLDKQLTSDEKAGLNIIADGVKAVFDNIVLNAGKNPTEIISQIDPDNNIGYDAKNHKVVDMFEAGIINPLKSDLLAFENAISVVKLFIQTNCVIVDEQPQTFIV